MHYAQAHAPKAPDGSALADPNAAYGSLPEHVPGHPYVHDPAQANDFRARFHRPLVAPSPFRSAIVPGSNDQQQQQQHQQQPQQQQPGSASAPPGGPPLPQLQPEPAQDDGAPMACSLRDVVTCSAQTRWWRSALPWRF